RWTKRQLYLGGNISRQHRRPSAWNAFVRDKMIEHNNGGYILLVYEPPCRAVGERYKLAKFITENKKVLKAEYAKLTYAQKSALALKLVKVRFEKSRIARDNPRAIHRDMVSTFACMNQEVLLLSQAWVSRFNENISSSQTRARPLVKLISDCRNHLQEELDDILREQGNIKGAKMNYTNYEGKIVERYGVALKG
ncbi:hypothetical protein BV22DRAFT_968483, partial [Leucogyrophana mollusca]